MSNTQSGNHKMLENFGAGKLNIVLNFHLALRSCKITERDGLGDAAKESVGIAKKNQLYREISASSHKKPDNPKRGPLNQHHHDHHHLRLKEKNTVCDRTLDSVPVTIQRKAKLLLHLFERYPHMRRDRQDVLEYQGTSLLGSNVIDFVNGVMRHCNGTKPKGWDHFAEGLKDINIPQEVVGNKQRWKEDDVFLTRVTIFHRHHPLCQEVVQNQRSRTIWLIQDVESIRLMETEKIDFAIFTTMFNT